MALNDITWAQGKQNMGGLKGEFYFVPINDVDFATPPALDVDGKTITGAITLQSLKKFYKAYFTKGTGKLDATSVGERDGKSFECMFEFRVPGNDVANLTAIEQMLNTPGLWIGEDASGNMIVLGISKNDDGTLHIDFPCYLESANLTTGATPADARGVTVQVKSESPHFPLFYTGAIDVDAVT